MSLYFSDTGYNKPTKQDIFDKVRTSFITKFGQDFDDSEHSLLGNIFSLISEEFYNLEEEIEDLVSQQNIVNCNGVNLDNRASSHGILRRLAFSTETYTFIEVENGGCISDELTIGFEDITRSETFQIKFSDSDRFKIINNANCNACTFFIDTEDENGIIEDGDYRIDFKDDSITFTANNNTNEDFLNYIKNRFFCINDPDFTPSEGSINDSIKFQIIDDKYIRLISVDKTILDFSCTSNVTIFSVGARFKFKCDTTGLITTPKFSLNTIKNQSQTDLVDSSFNIYNIESALVLGTDTETDQELKIRLLDTGNTFGSATVYAIRSRLLRVNNVQFVNVIDNKEHTTVGDLKPHSFKAIVVGGDDNEIANALMQVGDIAGIDSVGSIEQQIKEPESGMVRIIRFERPDNVNLEFNFDLSVTNYTTDAKVVLIRDIKREIIRITNSIKIGGKIIADLICTSAVNKVVENIENLVSRGNFGVREQNGQDYVPSISLESNQKSLTDESMITINLVDS